MTLSEYKKKRTFSSTSEPSGKKSIRTKHKMIFVVQKHRASQLHYDLRLELDGVLKSWAVPKGPSMNPHDKHLAIAVEDHPYEYKDFHGTIPKDNYGAGSVVIWDNGTYEPRSHSEDPEKVIREELRDGHITFILHGNKLKGEFALIKSEHIGKNSWLLIKKADNFAFDEYSKKPLKLKQRNLLKQTNQLNFFVAKKAPEPVNIRPMLATLTTEAFDNKDWIFEVKWDGYRAIASFDGNKSNLRSRNNIDFTKRFSIIANEVLRLKNKVVLDGEIVAVDDKGHPHFEWLQNYMTHSMGKLIYYVFDIIWCDGYDLQELSLQKRRNILTKILPKSEHLQFSDSVVGSGRKFFKIAERENLEGIMAKRKDSKYQQGRRGDDWLKIKTHLRQEVVVGGFTDPKGGRVAIGSLAVGVYSNDKLTYCGNVGGGFKDIELKELRKKLEKIRIKSTPFATEINSSDVVHWVSPKLVGEVSFAEWTSNGQMRQPIFLGFRPDKLAKDVKKELPKQIIKTIETATESHINKKVNFTNPDKVFFREVGYRKGDLWEYYKTVAKYILPYLRDRPQSLLRQPDGYNGEAFFQKDVATIAPNWSKKVSYYSDSAKKDITYLVCNDERTLQYMVQLGCIEINPWSSQIKKIKHPDWAVIDLDPEGVGFEAVIEVAKTVKKICERLKIPSYPKTSGKTGIHIYIPMGAKYSYSQVLQFTELFVNIVHKELPHITSLERSPKKRPHKVYLDYLQNRSGQTLASPYCVRPIKTANVSTPLHWREVRKGLRPEQFTIKTIPNRLKKVGDIFRPVLGAGIDIKKVLERIDRIE